MDFPVPLEDQEGFVPCFFYLTNLIDCVIPVITMKLLVECNTELNIELTLEQSQPVCAQREQGVLFLFR